MNIIFNGLHSQISIGILKNLLKNLQPIRKIICLASLSKIPPLQSFQNDVEIIIIPFQDTVEGIYPKVSTALDDKILAQLGQEWFTVLKMMDRDNPAMVFEFHKRMQLLFSHLQYWEHLITTHKINCFINVNYPHEIFDYTIYTLCKAKGIQTLFFTQTQLTGYVQLLEDIKQNDKRLKLDYNLTTANDSVQLPHMIEKVWQEQTQKRLDPFYMQINFANLKREHQYSQKIKHACKKFSTYLKQLLIKRFDIPSIARGIYFEACFGKSAEKRLFRRYSQLSIKPDFSKRFIYLPLHYQPECTTSPQGGFYVYQELMVELLSKSVPDNVQIYIKEHPTQRIQGRNERFYDHISSMRNVTLVDLQTPSRDLIEKCIAVATVTGTAGWEALFQGVPVLLFGYIFFQYSPGVYQIRNEYDLKKALVEILSNQDLQIQKRFRTYLSKIEPFLIRGWIDPIYEPISDINYDKNLENLSDALAANIKSP